MPGLISGRAVQRIKRIPLSYRPATQAMSQAAFRAANADQKAFLYGNSIVAYKTGTQQTVNLVLDTIHLAAKREKKAVAAELQLHSDQGFQYTSQAYFRLTKQYGITPSMSRKGNPYDNAKTECIYRHKPAAFAEAYEMIDRYILFYNHERIRYKTGVAPLSLRHSF